MKPAITTAVVQGENYAFFSITIGGTPETAMTIRDITLRELLTLHEQIGAMLKLEYAHGRDAGMDRAEEQYGAKS